MRSARLWNTCISDWIGSFLMSLAFLIVIGNLSAAHAQVPGDREIQVAVENEIAFDQAVELSDIQVEVEDGFVELSGVVENLLEKRRAGNLVGSVRGVIGLGNEILVVPPVVKTAAKIERDVESALTFDPATERFDVVVTASDDGRVNLSGVVNSWAERQAAAQTARSVIGVTGVQNLLMVEPAQNRSNTDIRNDVVSVLRWNTLIRSPRIAVDVKDGNVVLTGTVRSVIERDLAENLAGVAGAASVDVSGLEVIALDAKTFVEDPLEVNESTITAAVVLAIDTNPIVGKSVDVDVDGNVVTLRGTVNTLSEKLAAAREARDIVGVRTVVNRLRVRPETAGFTDRQLERVLKDAFLIDPVTESFEIDPRVDNGKARLNGTVDSYFEKSRAEQVASEVVGVHTVVNNLDVIQDETPMIYDPYIDPVPIYDYNWYAGAAVSAFKSDAEIREDIEDELWWSPFVDKEDITVVVDNGVATLTGSVDSWSEFRAARENAIEGGAVVVDNNLTIDPEFN